MDRSFSLSHNDIRHTARKRLFLAVGAFLAGCVERRDVVASEFSDGTLEAEQVSRRFAQRRVAAPAHVQSPIRAAGTPRRSINF